MALNVTSDIFLIDILDIWYITRVCLLFSFCCFVWLFAWLLNKRGNYRVSPILGTITINESQKIGVLSPFTVRDAIRIVENIRKNAIKQENTTHPLVVVALSVFLPPAPCPVIQFLSPDLPQTPFFWHFSNFCESKQFYVVFRPLHTQKII